MRQITEKSLARAFDAAMEQNAGREDEILTSEEARRLLKVGRTKLWDLTRRNMIPAYRVGEGRTSGLRYKRSELLGWLEMHRVGSQSAR